MSYRRTSPFIDRQQRRGQWLQPAPLQRGVESIGVVADPFDVVHGVSVLSRAGESAHPVTRMGMIWNTEGLSGAVILRCEQLRASKDDGRVPVAHPSRRGPLGRPQDDGGVCGKRRGNYSAGVGSGGGAAEGGAAAVALAVAAFFSTTRTAMIEPSYSASRGI